MSGSAPVALARSPVHDPALPGLAAVLSEHPPGASPDDGCRIRAVDWEPRRRCRVVQEVRAGGRDPSLVGFEVTPSRTVVRRPADDPALPGLSAVLDPVASAGRLAESCGAAVRNCRVTPVAWRPGVRAVVAYDVVAGSAPLRLYAKVLAGGAGRYARTTAGIARSARRAGLPVPVPEVVAHWPDLQAVVMREAPGRTLSDVLRDGSVPVGVRRDSAEALGRLLAQLHSAAEDGAPPWTAEDELAALERLLGPAWAADPAAGRSLAALVDRLADTVPPAGGTVLTHGAFRTGQVLVHGAALRLLDLDTVGRSDPGRDVGNALAYLTWADVRGALPPALGSALREAFVVGYSAGRPGAGEPVPAWWTAAAMGKIAGRRYRTLAAAEWPLVPELLQRAAALVGPPARAPAGPDLLDPDRMTEVLRRASVPARGPLRVVSARVLGEAAGRRRVVRYEVTGIDPGSPVGLVGKVYTARHRATMAAQNLRILHDEVFGTTPGRRVPQPAGSVPALRMVLHREVVGTALDRLPSRRAVAASAGAWLATLHSSPAVLTRRVDLVHEVEQVAGWAGTVSRTAPGTRALVRDLADRIAAAAAELPAAPEVPLHRDFHPGHVLAVGEDPARDGGRAAAPPVAVIDLDEARMGDPALDVAHFATYLDVSGGPPALDARDAFRAAYGPVTGPAAEDRLAFWAAWTHLKIAKQLVTGRGPVRAAAGETGRAALAAVLRKGTACLGG